MQEEEKRWEKSERKRRKNARQVGRRGSRRMDGYDGNGGVMSDIRDHEGYDAHGRDRAR